MRILLAALFVPLFALAAPACAHHSLSGYDGSINQVLVGTVTAYQWQNPHVLLRLRPADAEADDREYVFEGGDINRLMRLGWLSDSMRAGDIVMVTFNPLKNGLPGGHLVEVATARGETFSLLRYRFEGDPPPVPENIPGPLDSGYGGW